MPILDRVTDAEVLWREGRREGALLIALAAVAATARRRYTKGSDRDAFERFLHDASSVRLSLEFRGEVHTVEHILYKWLRCELVHEGGLPPDVAVVPDPPDLRPGGRWARAGGAPDYRVLFSEAWFYFLLHAVQNAPELSHLAK